MKPLHRNLLIASNLYRASALATVLAYLLADVANMVPEMLMIAFMLIVAYLIRAGFRWLKWMLLVWELYNVPAFIALVSKPWSGNTGTTVLLIIIEILQVVALVFLFLPRKEEPDMEPEDEEEQPADTE
ncbi:hypothetical protein ACFQZS_18525 [Mucilaginibacter calamicampi]|uniref:Uncharacterized protein n=1 Tax=Mucilaginibacter calamicampi TaxID=1302352 RepID=A0ABW2Z2S7_9SPHI